MKYWEDLKPGEKVLNFREQPCTFVSIERRPSPGRDGKVLVRVEDDQMVRTFYARVFPDVAWKLTEVEPSGKH